MNSETVQVDDIQLTAQTSAVNCADMFVRFTLEEWRLQALRDDAARVACAMVQLAVESAAATGDRKAPGFLTVRLRLRGDDLVIEVANDHPGALGEMPRALEGLHCGVEPGPGKGKLMWCELPLPSGVTASAVPLPRRERRHSPAAEQEPGDQAEVDPAVIRRILSGLGATREQEE